MLFKFIFENLQTGEKKPIKTLREIAGELGIEYHHARSLFLQSSPDTAKKFLHPYIKQLSSKYKIYTNPDIIK